VRSNFNAVHYASELAAAGVSSDQARVHANAFVQFAGDLAYAADLKNLEERFSRDMHALRDELRTLKDEVRELTLEFRAFVAATDKRFAALEARVTALEAHVARIDAELKLHRWCMGLGFSLSLSLQLAILVKLFIP
jgi:polyhydroxyalkanoate synthesis regulator phasin